MKRILFFNYEYPPLGGGAANATSYILREFEKYSDLQIDLITSSVGEFRIEKIAPNITIHYLNIYKNNNLHYQSIADLLVYSWKLYFYAKKLIKINQYDLCHAFFGIPCGFIAMALRIPYIVSLRGSDVPFYNKRFYYLDKVLFKVLSRIVWEKAISVIALSNDLIDIARRTSEKQPIAVIYNGIDIAEFYPEWEGLMKEKTFNILFVGRLIERKGLNYLLEAFKNITSEYENARLYIAGDGPLKDGYVEYVKNNKIDDKVFFLGRVDHMRMARLYRKCHLFVLPSLNEALGNVTQEALASGLPIVTTKTGAAELMDGNGFIINKKTSSEIENAIRILIGNKDLCDNMARKSRQLAEDMSWEKTAKKYYQIYNTSIEKKNEKKDS
jgi:glycosyltransferase involved in cell wall biosynthesis